MSLGRRLQDLLKRLSTSCIFSVSIHRSRRSCTRLVRLLRRATSYSSHLSYHMERNDKLRFHLLGGNTSANVYFQTIPGKRRFDSLLLTILGTSKGKGGLPSTTVTHHVRTLRKPLRVAACVSLAYAGYPSIIRTLGIVTLFGPRVARITMSKTLFRRRARHLGVRTIPTIFINKRLLRIKHDALKRLLSGLRTGTKVHPRRMAPDRRRFSVLITKNKPTKATTTICSTHGKLGITVITKEVNKRIGRAINVRGLVSIPCAAKRTLTNSLEGRLSTCRVTIFSGQRVRSFVLRNRRGILQIGKNRVFHTPTLVITANTS